MKLGKIIDAGSAIFKLTKHDLLISEAYKLHSYVSGLRSCVDFYEQEIHEIAKKYNAVSLGNGQYRIEGRAKDFENEINELRNLDIGDVPMLTIEVPDSLKLSSNDIQALEGMITLKFNKE